MTEHSEDFVTVERKRDPVHPMTGFTTAELIAGLTVAVEALRRVTPSIADIGHPDTPLSGSSGGEQ